MLFRFLCSVVLMLGGITSAIAANFQVGDLVDVQWSGSWYKARVIGAEEGKWRITYEGYSSSWDETVGPERIRARTVPVSAPASSELIAANTTPASSTTASAPAAAQAPTTFPFPERPAGKRAGLEGAFLRVQSWYFNGRLSLTNEGWFFTKQGRVSLTPLGGFSVAEFDQRAEARKTDGVYWIEDSRLVVRWANQSKLDEYDFEQKPDGSLTLNGLAATPVDGFPRGWRIDAEYEGGATYSGGGSFLASSNTLRLHRDGTFGGESIGSLSTQAGGQSVGSSSANASSGTYEFDGYTLTLHHADGRHERRTVFAFGDRDPQGAPQFIWREGTMLSLSKTAH